MKNLLIILSLFVSSFSIAQNEEQKQIIYDTYSFVKLFEQKDYYKITELTYPKIVEQVGKETFINFLAKLNEGDEEHQIKILTPDIQSFEISDIFKTKEGEKYAFVNFPMNMEMTFLKEEFDNEKQDFILKMFELKGMKAHFLNSNKIPIKHTSLTIAINDIHTQHTWKYFNYDSDNPLIVKLFPLEVIKHAKTYKADLLLKLKENEQ